MYVTSAMEIWKKKQQATYGEICQQRKKDHTARLKKEYDTFPAERKEPYEKIARDHQVRQALMAEAIAGSLQKKEGGNCMSHVTIANWLKAKPTFRTYSKHVRPGLTDVNREKQVAFAQHVMNN